MSNFNPNLGNVVSNAQVRKWIYSIYIVAVIVIGAFQIAFGAIDVVQPDWLTIAVAVAAYLGIPVGTLAAANTETSGKHEL